MAADVTPDWIAVDWGTTNLRAWAMRGGAPVAQAQSGEGMGTLRKEDFAPALARLISDWQVSAETDIIACGMVGSRQGWVEAPYRAVPCTPLDRHMVQMTEDGLNLRVISGLKQSDPPDVMRGEETQIAGFLALNKGWDGVICLPGTHTKWVHVSADEVVSFQTFMTGEIFSLLSQSSVLRHSVGSDGWNEAIFDNTVTETLSKPETLAARLFAVRAGDLLQNTPSDTARTQLSALLVGAELAAARPYWLGTNIAILGSCKQAQVYARALQTQGATAMIVDAERMTLAGLTAAYRNVKETT